MTISLICAGFCFAGAAVAFAQDETVDDAVDLVDTEAPPDADDVAEAVNEAASKDDSSEVEDVEEADPADEAGEAEDVDEFADDEAEAEESAYDYRGPFVRTAFTFANFKEEDSDIQFDDALGLTVALGWRHNAWFALELSYASFFGSETDDYLKFDRIPLDEEDGTKKLHSSEFALNAKIYPLGFESIRNVRDSPLLRNMPDILQPYGAIGFGYSLQDVAVLDQTRPAFRFVGGLDLIAWEPVAITVEGGYTLHRHLVRRNRGTHIDGTYHVSVGTTLRF